MQVDTLTHRVGRTARMGNDGRALTFLTPENAVLWRRLSRQGGPDIEQLLGTGGWRYRSNAPAPGRHTHATTRPAPAGTARRSVRLRDRDRRA
jgi:ATP-dependent RNA helicase RhlE